MKKNVASQKIGCQMVSASDGSAFTGAVTVAVTGDAGTQATGSVGAGACTHEGNGYHTYAPAQAETNYDLVAFTFTGTGAVPATVQVYTNFPQTVDNATAIASILALLDDARTEPGQGAPPVNPDAMTKLDYLYKAWRNKKTNDGTETKLYADDGTTIDHKQATSESAGTVTKAEWATGA